MMAKSKLINLAAMVGLAAAIFAVYLPAMASPFIFDDLATIGENASIVRLWPLIGDVQHPGPLNPSKDMTTAGRPLVNFTLALNFHFGRENPLGYHLFNLTVHCLSALLLMAIVRRTLLLDYFAETFPRAPSVAPGVAFVAALLWAVHPLHSEAVMYVTQRTELMVGFFYLAVLYCSLRYWTAAAPAVRKFWLPLATAACLAGMASKEVMVTAPVVVLLFQRTFLAGSVSRAWRRSWPLYLGLSLGWALLLYLNFQTPRSGSAGFHLGVPAYVWWFTQAKVLLMYLKLAVWPWPQSIYYELPYLETLRSAWPWVATVALLTLATLVLLWRRRAAGFVGAWVFLTLSPTFVVPIVTEVAAERRMYLPMAALAPLVVVGGFYIAQRAAHLLAVKKGRSSGASPESAVIGLGLLMALVLSLVCVRRLADYHDAVTLWKDTLSHQPRNVFAHINLAAALNESGKPQEAIEQCEEALRLKPGIAPTYYNLGEAQRQLGHLPEAIAAYRSAIELQPDYVYARARLGNALLDTGKTDEAIQQYQEALRQRPDSAEIYYNLGRAFKRAGQLADAIQYYQRALTLNPDYPEAHNNLGLALKQADRLPEAVEHYRQALDLKPEYTAAMVNLATAYAQMKRSDEAIATAQKALELARSQRQTEIIEQIEAWLPAYRQSVSEASPAVPAAEPQSNP